MRQVIPLKHVVDPLGLPSLQSVDFFGSGPRDEGRRGGLGSVVCDSCTQSSIRDGGKEANAEIEIVTRKGKEGGKGTRAGTCEKKKQTETKHIRIRKCVYKKHAPITEKGSDRESELSSAQSSHHQTTMRVSHAFSFVNIYIFLT